MLRMSRKVYLLIILTCARVASSILLSSDQESSLPKFRPRKLLLRTSDQEGAIQCHNAETLCIEGRLVHGIEINFRCTSKSRRPVLESCDEVSVFVKGNPGGAI